MSALPSRPDVAKLLALAVEGVGGEPRDGQVAMAEAAAASMRSGQHLLVQAGTGTGKSLAYLVPAIAHALDEGGDQEPVHRGDKNADADAAAGQPPDSGDETGPVVVATATIALQRQLIERDLPRLVESLQPALPRTPTFAILKGRRNYLCLQRFHAGPDDEQAALFDGEEPSPRNTGPTSMLGREILRVGEWVSHTVTGDRDELVPGVTERVWSQVAVSSRECLGANACPYGADCFAERARMRAMRADVVVTNHALLAIDALSDVAVLPEHDVVVVDEAHELVDRVTGVATEELTGAIVERAATRCRRLAPQEAANLDDAAAALTDVVSSLPLGQLRPMPEPLADALALVRDAARATVMAITTTDAPKPAANAKGDAVAAADAEVVRRQARAAVEAVFDTAARMVADATDDVIWAASDERRGAVLHVAPLRIAPLLKAALFSRRTVVMTSATLAIGGSFEPVAANIGLHGERWQGLDVGSPFEHTKQGILYVAKHLPPPGRDGLTDATFTELAELIDAAGGRTLGLFSSMRAATEASAAMRTRLDVPILCQGDDATSELVRQFAADPKTCLFGTLSLWQGVDVPGPSCQLVVVDRIPFPRPDDPLTAARQRAVADAGGNGFMAVAAAQAALLLAQGAGRLLRSRVDRGVVAVLDSRLATARYAGFLRASLPPFWYTTDAEVVRRSLRVIDEAAGGRRREPEHAQLALDDAPIS